MLGFVPQDSHGHGELDPPPHLISGARGTSHSQLVILLSLCGALLSARCGGHHGWDVARLMEGWGREGFLEEEMLEQGLRSRLQCGGWRDRVQVGFY